MLGRWHDQFERHIIARGEDYFMEDCVEDLTFKDGKIRATVYGTDVYSVTISLDDNGVSTMDCNCPYSRSGYNCKHMVAVLLAAENESDTLFVVETNVLVDDILECLQQADVADLRSFIRQQMEGDPALARAFYDQFAPPITANQWEDQWRQAIDRLFRRWPLAKADAEREDFWLENKELLAIMEDAERTSSFSELLGSLEYFMQKWHPYTQGMNDHSWYEVRDMVTDRVERWIDERDRDEQFELLQWIGYVLTNHSVHRARVPGLRDLLFQRFMQPEELKYKVALLEASLDNFFAYQSPVEERWNSGFFLLNHCSELYRQLGDHGKATDIWHRYLSQGRMWQAAVRYFDEQGEYYRALDLLMEAKKKFSDQRVFLSAFSRSIVEIHLRLGNVHKAQDESRRCLLGYAQYPIAEWKGHKQLFSEEQWPEERTSLLDALAETGRDLAPFYAAEGMLPELLNMVLSDPREETFWEYEPLLASEYPDQMLPVLLRRLQELAEKSKTRPKYYELNLLLNHLNRYPNGKNVRKELTARWKEQFASRRAMMQELNLKPRW